MTHDLVIRSGRVMLPDGERPAAVAVTDGRIAAITGHRAVPAARQVADLGEVPLLPGLVDTHVHVNEPGRTHWEGFASATKAAAAGGITTIVDMPLNALPPTIDPEALELKRRAAKGQTYTDVGFWGGAVPLNAGRLQALHEAGVFGFKCFTSDSGVPEFPALSEPELAAVLTEAAGLDALIIVHAEDPRLLTVAAASDDSFAGFEASRPAAAEISAVRSVIALARRTGARVHILHVSSARAATEIGRARRGGVDISAETCPHYLCLSSADVPDGAAAYKCCPPIRDEANRDALWTALAAGHIDCVVSDHSPCPPQHKTGGLRSAWGGIASVQLGLPVMWTQARRRGRHLDEIVAWMSTRPARLAGLHRKGAIAVGGDADLVAFDPDHRWRVRAQALHHRHPITPYDGMELIGAVRSTWLRGRLVGATPTGRLLSKED